MAKFSIKSDAYAALEAKYQCMHEVREVRLRTIADGRLAYYRQCIKCGNAGNAVSAKLAKSERQGQESPIFDDDLEHKWHAQKQAEYLTTYKNIAPQLRAEYHTYLASIDWADRREQVLIRANYMCECCEHFVATQVHHMTYERIGNELDTDLMAVCPFCHSLIHGYI